MRRVRVRQHVNPDGTFFERMAVSPLVLDGREIELEVGCAEAQFLFERAARAPHRRYVGLEIREKLVDFVNRRARVERAPVEAVFCHAGHHLADMFPPASVARVYLNFPDPWFKRKHHVRRMIDADLVAAIATIIVPDGEVLVQSDVWDVALDAMGVLDARDDAFENASGPWTFWRGPNPYGVRSWREGRCQEEGLPIWRILYRRRAAAEG